MNLREKVNAWIESLKVRISSDSVGDLGLE